MVYAYPSNRVFVTSKKPKKTVPTKEQRELIDFLDSHSVAIYRDKDGKIIAKVTKDK